MKRRSIYILILPLTLLLFIFSPLPLKESVSSELVKINILSLNDFHGQLHPVSINGQKIGGVATLISYLKSAEKGDGNQTIIVLGGDNIGASPADSSLLHDEPTIMAFNTLANQFCNDKFDKKCNLVSTIGNHEFDRGVDELKRLINGGNSSEGPFLENPWGGAKFPFVCANIVDEQTGTPLFPPYVIKTINDIPIAFVGAVLKDAPSTIIPTSREGLLFRDEADSINQYVPELNKQGVHAIIAIIHQGGDQTVYDGVTTQDSTVTGAIVPIVKKLDKDIDIVISGHTHKFTNTYLKNAGGKQVLVTQSHATGFAFANIDLDIDPVSHDIVSKKAHIISTNNRITPPIQPDETVKKIVERADEFVAPIVNRKIGFSKTNVTRQQNSSGESALGDLVADAQRCYGNTDFSFMNPGGIRADIPEGLITWGNLFAIQPFSNTIVTMELTGDQIRNLLGQQWLNQTLPIMLQISGLKYKWSSNNSSVKATVYDLEKEDGTPIEKTKFYTVTTNSFLATGGNNFSIFTDGINTKYFKNLALESLVNYIEAKQKVDYVVHNRIIKTN